MNSELDVIESQRRGAMFESRIRASRSRWYEAVTINKTKTALFKTLFHFDEMKSPSLPMVHKQEKIKFHINWSLDTSFTTFK